MKRSRAVIIRSESGPMGITAALEVLSPRAGDLLIIKTAGQTQAVIFAEQLRKKINDMPDAGRPGKIGIVAMSDGVSLEMLDRTAMEVIGWVRQEHVCRLLQAADENKQHTAKLVASATALVDALGKHLHPDHPKHHETALRKAKKDVHDVLGHWTPF